jgi:hypothetical protein
MPQKRKSAKKVKPAKSRRKPSTINSFDSPDTTSPQGAIQAATAASPAFKYATVVGGLVATVAAAYRFGLSSITMVFGVLVLLVLMVLFFLFSQATSALKKGRSSLPATVFLWSFMLIGILSTIFIFGCLLGSIFLDKPLPMAQYLEPDPPIDKPIHGSGERLMESKDTVMMRLGDISNWTISLKFFGLVNKEIILAAYDTDTKSWVRFRSFRNCCAQDPATKRQNVYLNEYDWPNGGNSFCDTSNFTPNSNTIYLLCASHLDPETPANENGWIQTPLAPGPYLAGKVYELRNSSGFKVEFANAVPGHEDIGIASIFFTPKHP